MKTSTTTPDYEEIRIGEAPEVAPGYNFMVEEGDRRVSPRAKLHSLICIINPTNLFRDDFFLELLLLDGNVYKFRFSPFSLSLFV